LRILLNQGILDAEDTEIAKALLQDLLDALAGK